MIDATLVTIHGFWSSPATWEGLNKVWRADEELRGLRIHPFGYPSPKKPRLRFSSTRMPDYADIAQTLATEYATVLADASNIAFVAHSQGGLILQRFLAWMVNEGRARELSRIRSVVMLACPNGGSEYLQSVRRAFGDDRHPQAGSLRVLDRQVADAQRTVLQWIVNATACDDHQCRIPFHVYAGASDNIVKAASAQATFPGASTLAGNHFTILDPDTTGNRTAETVKRHLLADITAWSDKMPSMGELPEGSVGDFVEFMIMLYMDAHQPSFEELGSAIGEGGEKTLRMFYQSFKIPEWRAVEAIVLTLCDRAGMDPESRKEFHKQEDTIIHHADTLWTHAYQKKYEIFLMRNSVITVRPDEDNLHSGFNGN